METLVEHQDGQGEPQHPVGMRVINFPGRADLVAETCAVLSDPGKNAVLLGAAGMGKSTLATRVVTALIAGGQAKHHVHFAATAATAATPLGLFKPVLEDYDRIVNERPEKVALQIVRACASTGAAQGEGRKVAHTDLVIVIDNAHLLDNMSALVLDTLLARTDIRVVLTCKTKPGLTPALVRAWRDDMLAQVRIPALTGAEIATICGEVLPKRRIAPQTLDRLERVSGGNTLFLTELLRTLDRSNSLEERQGIWVWRTELPENTTLTDIIRLELEALAPEHRVVFETIALSAPISLHLLGATCDLDAVSMLVEQGLVEISRPPGAAAEPMVTLTHPIYGEAASALINQAQITSRLRALYRGVMGSVGAILDPGELLQVASWALASGEQLPLDRLVSAFALTRNLADYEFRIRLTTALIKHPNADATIRAEALICRLESFRFSNDPVGVQTDFELAKQLFETMAPGPERSDLLITFGEVSADAFTLQQSKWQEALDALDWVQERLHTESPDLLETWRLDTARAVTQGYGGLMAQSYAIQTRLYREKSASPDLLPLGSTSLITLAQRGESKAARSLARQQLSLAARNTKRHPLIVGDLVGAWCLGDMLSGNLREASVVYGLLNVAIDRNPGNVRVRRTLVAFGRGLLAKAQGAWGTAVENLELACSELDDFSGTGSEGLLLASLALAQAAVADREGSERSMQEYYVRSEQTSRLLEIPCRYSILLARLYFPTGGEMQEARALVALARHHEFRLMEMLALHAIVLTDPTGLTRAEDARLALLASQVDAPLAPLLVASCEHIAEGGERGTGSAARALARRGLVIPFGRPIEGLTSREQQLAELLALGFSNAQISKRLVISKRTTETHTAKVLQKLNVKSRDDVADALEQSARR